MLDNLFIVESPLQALVATELSLQFKNQSNGVIYLLSGKDRLRNNQQIMNVIEYGDWCLTESVKFSDSGRFIWLINSRRYIEKIRNRFRGNVKNLFFGEFRSQWMHLARFSIAPEKCILMDDGFATLTVKKQFIDQGIFYPKQAWNRSSLLKQILKDFIYFGLYDSKQAAVPILIASSFLKDECEYRVNFSAVRRKFKNLTPIKRKANPKAYYFGAKYSEAGIVTREYELKFLLDVFLYYKARGLDVIYCAHRDESEEKLMLITKSSNVNILLPSMPAEIFILQHDHNVVEISAAYSSVVNNLHLIYPDKPVKCFRLAENEINPYNLTAIRNIYSYFEENNIPIIDL